MLLLARHGETASNRVRRFQGRQDVPLNATGRAQAADLAERVAGEGIAALWCSPLRRARETADVVAARLGLEPRVDPRLTEIDVGDWSGRLYEEVAAQEPERFGGWVRPTADWRFPGGESVPEQVERVAAVLAEIRTGALPALVVCHGGVIRAARLHAEGLPVEEYHAVEVANCAVVRL